MKINEFNGIYKFDINVNSVELNRIVEIKDVFDETEQVTYTKVNVYVKNTGK